MLSNVHPYIAIVLWLQIFNPFVITWKFEIRNWKCIRKSFEIIVVALHNQWFLLDKAKMDSAKKKFCR